MEWCGLHFSGLQKGPLASSYANGDEHFKFPKSHDESTYTSLIRLTVYKTFLYITRLRK